MHRSQTINTNPSSASSGLTMTKFIRESRCHRHPARKGSYNEKYASSTIPKLRAIGVRLKPLSGEMDSIDNQDSLQFCDDGHVGSTSASQKKLPQQSSLHSIGEMDSFYDDDEDQEDVDGYDDDSSGFGDTNFHQRNVASNCISASLRSIGVSIRSLPREIELLDTSIVSEYDEYCTRKDDVPKVVDILKSSLRSIDESTCSLLREMELLDDVCNYMNQAEKGGRGREHGFSGRSKSVASRVSFVSRRTDDHRQTKNKNQQQTREHSHSSGEDAISVENLVAHMSEKVLLYQPDHKKDPPIRNEGLSHDHKVPRLARVA